MLSDGDYRKFFKEFIGMHKTLNDGFKAIVFLQIIIIVLIVVAQLTE